MFDLLKDDTSEKKICRNCVHLGEKRLGNMVQSMTVCKLNPPSMMIPVQSAGGAGAITIQPVVDPENDVCSHFTRQTS